MEICVLASGSSGNCFYIGNNKNKKGILIDAGISSKQLVERLEIIGKKPQSIRGIFITHEHADHTKGADVFARHFNVPIFATKKTIDNRFLCSDENLLNAIKNDESIDVAGLSVEAFSKSHGASDPISFSVSQGKLKSSVITDLGFCCKNVIKNISDSNFLCIESNHDVNMLEDGPYPYYLKKWIKSDTGHLSNMQASLGVLEHGSSKLKNVILSHISKTNNTSELALSTFKNLIKERHDLKNLDVSVSQREAPTDVFRI